MIRGALRIAVVVAGALASLASGGSQAQVKQQNENRLQALRERAAFDFNCSEDSIETTVLVENVWIEQAGARGCSRRATYVWVEQKGWVMNTSSSEGEAAEPEPTRDEGGIREPAE